MELTLDQIKMYDINHKAFKVYRCTVDGCRDIDYELARKKLSRNIFMCQQQGQPVKENDRIAIYKYGLLEITVSKENDEIVFIKNHSFRKDEELYNQLNELLGIV